MSETPPFVHTLSSGLGPVETSDDLLSIAELDNLNRRCDEFRRHRDQALIDGASYLVAGGEQRG